MQPAEKRWLERISFSLVSLVLVFIACLGILYIVAGMVFDDRNPAFDNRVFEWLAPYINSRNTRGMKCITFFGSQTFLLPANIVLVLVFLRTRETRKYAWKIAVVAITSTAVLFFLKSLLKRERPLVPLIAKAHNFSFPSGHTFTSITFFGVLCYIVYKTVPNPFLKWGLIACMMLLLTAIAVSRVYLKLHFATDVIAGGCLGIIWLLLARWILFNTGKINNR
jgi:membrane-associated phospholipid phosphatase